MLHSYQTRRRIISAYSQPGPASLDLVGAVLRQGSFVEKMNDMEWTSTNLAIAVARYHAFLDLMTTSVGPSLVPTLDIVRALLACQRGFGSDLYRLGPRLAHPPAQRREVSSGYSSGPQAFPES